MSLHTFSAEMPLPQLHIPAGLGIEACDDPLLLSILGEIPVDEARRRMANDHQAFVARIYGRPAAFGWMARGKALIGELNHELVLPIGHRYLWNFRTLAEYRGLGIYPVLLQYILRYERPVAERFWIIHAPENKASLKGIVKSGFTYAGDLYAGRSGKVAFVPEPSVSIDGEVWAAMDFDVAAASAASCWNCSSPWLKKRKAHCCCTEAGVVCADSRELQKALAKEQSVSAFALS